MNAFALRRSVRGLLSGGRRPESSAAVFKAHRLELTRAMTLVRVFYGMALFVLLNKVRGWAAWSDVDTLFLLWPVAWIDGVGVQAGIQIVLAFGLIGTLAGALAPEFRAARIAAAVALTLDSALTNSLAGTVITHGLHTWLWTAWLFVLLPSGSPARILMNRARRLRFTQIFWSAQACIALFYSLAGLFKVAGFVLQLSRGEVHAFSVDALARHTALRMLEGSELPSYFFMGPTLVDYPAIGMLIFPLSIFLECFAFVAVFRPAIHRIYFTGLIGMHLGIFFVMSILFTDQIGLVAILFLCSPFSPSRVVWREVLLQWPVIGDALTWIGNRRRAHMESQTDSESNRVIPPQ